MPWMFIAALVVFSIADLLLLRIFAARKDRIAVRSTALSLALFWLSQGVAYFLHFRLPKIVSALLLGFLLLHSYFGYFRNLYRRSKTFDRAIHTIGSLGFSLYVYFFLSNILKYGGSRLFRAFYLLALGTFLGVIYELTEFQTDQKEKRTRDTRVELLQRGLKDTDVDLLCDVLGSAAAAVILYFSGR